MTEIPPAVQRVLDAAVAWAYPHAEGVGAERLNRELADAVRALTPPEPVLPPIPDPGPYLDKDGEVCEIFKAESGGSVCYASTGVCFNWDTAHEYGPFTRLVPETDAAELAEALREFAERDCRCIEGFDACKNPDHVRVRALLAKRTPAVKA
ncbi:hypothetical protein [Lysinibacillus fusiformis]|uniref:hypothetical protein n=1 Tax=Lysinibacillus fusiformis TaxID=28031 RepID=UPI003D047EB8